MKNDKDKISSFKTKLMAQGFYQVKEEWYKGIFSSVINFTLICMFFCLLVVAMEWKHTQWDITSAYLYALIR